MNLAKVDQARQTMFKRIADQEEKARQLHKKKEKLVQEVKEFLGYAVDPKDPRFKELIEAKEKEQKKKEKEVKKSERQIKLMARLSEAAAMAKAKIKDASVAETSAEKPKEDS